MKHFDRQMLQRQHNWPCWRAADRHPAREEHHQFRVFDFGMYGWPGATWNFNSARWREPAPKLADARFILSTVYFWAAHTVITIQTLLFAFFLGRDLRGGLGVAIILLKSNCCPIPTKFPVSQYKTRPLEAL